MKPAVVENNSCDTVVPVFETYRDTLVKFISSRIQNPVDREELVSDVFMKVYNHCEKLPEIRNIESWLITISRNAIIDYYRSKSKIQFGDIPEIAEEPASPELSQELASCVPGMIEKLPKKYAGPVFDYEILGIPQKELANSYGLSESGLKSRVQRGRKMMRELFMKHCGDLIDLDESCSDCQC